VKTERTGIPHTIYRHGPFSSSRRFRSVQTETAAHTAPTRESGKANAAGRVGVTVS